MTKNRFNELRSLETSLPTVNSASKAVDMHPTNQLDPYYLGTLCAEKLMENESLDYNYAAVRLLHDFNRVNQNIGEICEVISKMPEHLKIFFIKAFLHVSNEEQRLYLAKYYLMAILEGDDVLSNWVSDALQEVSKNSIEPLLEWYSASITFNRKICSDKGYVFFKNKRSLTEIYKKCIDVFHGTSQSSEEISKSSDDNYVMHYNLNISNTRTVERVLFIFNKPFTDKNNIHLRVCRTFASLLEEGGVKVEFAVTGEGVIFSPWGVYPALGKVRDIDSIRYVFIPDFQRSCKKIDYYENFLNWLNSQNYQVLISPTGPYDSHVFRRSFFQQIAIIQLPMSTSLNQANCPDEYTDILISRSDHHLKSLREKFPEKISKIYDFRFPLSIFETNGFLNHERDREMVVIATVLGGDRIYNFFKQLTRYERDVFFKIFEEPRVHWFFVGTYRCQEILNLDDRFVLLNNSGRLSIIARIEDLANFYSHVDIYFNLPGVSGGGGAILQALVNGVAALSAFDSDSAPDLPKDALYANFREGFALLGSLISDQEKRKDILSGFEDIRRCRNIELCVNNAIEITNAAFHNSLTRLLNMK